MDLATLELDVDFDDLQPVSEQPCDSGKRGFFFGVLVSFIFEVAFVQLGELT
jgi:hypothetical protein